MSGELILFDLPSKGRTSCWSLNPWKTRAALNFKGIPYKTEWVEYPDMAAKFQSFGIPPTADNSPSGWSIPAVRLPDGTYIMDSRAIADALEKMKPEPSFQLQSGYVERVQNTVLEAMKPLTPIMMPRIPEKLLNESSANYFRDTRAKRFGMPLEEYAKCDKAGETAWTNAAPQIKALASILHENESGPYVLGKDPSYPDLILAGLWVFVSRLDNGGDLFARIMKHDEALLKHWEACQEFIQRDD